MAENTPQQQPVRPLPLGAPTPTQVEEIRISDLLVTARSYLIYILKRWWLVLIIMALGGAAGFLYAFSQDEDYITESTYLINSGMDGSSVLSSLMSLAGAFGVTGTSKSEGFTNELLHGIIQSRRVIKEAMMTRYMIDGKFDHLGNHMLLLYPDWVDDNDYEGFSFQADSFGVINSKEDSVLEKLYLKIREDHLTVSYDEFSGLNTMVFRTLSRDLSVRTSEHILQSASDFFINSAVAKEKKSLEIAIHQSDSLMGVLKAKEALLAQLNDQKGYGFMAADLLTEGRLLRDIEVLSTMYATNYASLEVARTNLNDKKPIIEIVDQPEFATFREEIKVIIISLIAAVVAAFLAVLFLILRKAITDILAEEEQEAPGA
jgi:hypothetical protein